MPVAVTNKFLCFTGSLLYFLPDSGSVAVNTVATCVCYHDGHPWLQATEWPKKKIVAGYSSSILDRFTFFWVNDGALFGWIIFFIFSVCRSLTNFLLDVRFCSDNLSPKGPRRILFLKETISNWEGNLYFVLVWNFIYLWKIKCLQRKHNRNHNSSCSLSRTYLCAHLHERSYLLVQELWQCLMRKPNSAKCYLAVVS